MFAQPALGGGFYRPRDHEGHLVLITKVAAKDRHFDEMKGAEIDRLTVNIVDLDGDGELEHNVFLTHAGIVNKVNLNGPTLGRIGQEKFKKGMGFTIQPYNPGQDDTKAQAWLAAHPDTDLVSTPSAPAPAVAVGAGTAGVQSTSGAEATGRVSLNDMRTVGIQTGQVDQAAVNAAQQQRDLVGSLFTNEPPF